MTRNENREKKDKKEKVPLFTPREREKKNVLSLVIERRRKEEKREGA